MPSTARLFTVAVLIVAASATPAMSAFWAKQLGGSGTGAVVAIAVTIDGAGNVYTVGEFDGTADFDPGPGTYNLTASGSNDVFMSKLDREGNFVWAVRFGTSTRAEVVGGIAFDTEGDAVYTVGTFSAAMDCDPGPGSYILPTAGNTDAFISKFDGAGSFLWARALGGSAGDGAIAVLTDSLGNVYTIGYFAGTADFDPGPGIYNQTSEGDLDAFLSKLDSAGNFLWARRLGSSARDIGTDLALDSVGNPYIVGFFSGTVDFDPGPGSYTLTSAGATDAYISKLDGAGSFAWARAFGGSSTDGAKAVVLDREGNILIGGYFYATVDFDPGPETHDLVSSGDADGFISKLDSAGNLLWAKRFGGSLHDDVEDAAVDSIGNVYTVGNFRDSADFDPGPGTYRLVAPQADADPFISKLDGAGNFVWATNAGGSPAGNGADGVVVDRHMNVHAVGHFRSTADFDPGPGVYTLTPAGWGDAFVLKLYGCSRFLGDENSLGRLLFSPACTQDASQLAQGIFGNASASLFRGPSDRLYLSSQGAAFSPLVVDDLLLVNGVDSGLGPYENQLGIPPYLLDAPIESNLIPLPAHEVTDLIPVGQSTISFELLDTQGTIYGNTYVYLMLDCAMSLAGSGPTMIHFVTHDDQVAGLPPEFEVRYGLLSELRADQGFARTQCLGRFVNTPATETLPVPPVGDGYYYLARGLSSCVVQGYGDSSLVPDPRDALDALPVCP